MTYTVGSLFSGIGGLDLAAHWAGFTTSWFVEREPFCQQVLAKHWPGVPIHDDVFKCHDLPHVDLVVGGFPCQPFSVAGKQDGDKDERYLLLEMLRIVREVKPYVVLFENVPGFSTLDDGVYFKYLLREIASMGYDAEWGHPRAQDCGAPHKRERWFCVAYLVNAPQCASYIDESVARKQEQTIATATSERHGRKPVRRSTMADPVRNRRAQGDRSSGCSTPRPLWQCQPKRGGEIMGNADSQGRQKPLKARQRTYRAKSRARMDYRLGRSSYSGRQRWQAQSEVCGVAHGLPGRMDFVGWPARPGESQYPYEPSRVTTAKTPDRAARLKALGNAVVPQVAYPLFVAIREWLKAQDEREGLAS